jgi:hypothetical protein
MKRATSFLPVLILIASVFKAFCDPETQSMFNSIKDREIVAQLKRFVA